MILRSIDRLGVRTLDTETKTVRLVNRTNDTSFVLTDEQYKRWFDYISEIIGAQKKRG